MACLQLRRDYSRRYYAAHRAECKRRSAEYQRKNVIASRARRHAYTKAHPERARAQQKAWRESLKGKLCARKAALKARYGLSLPQYKEMVLRQSGCCAICGMPVARLFVDHDHKTGKVRSLLCIQCNGVIGHARDDANVLKKAIAYLKTYDVDAL